MWKEENERKSEITGPFPNSGLFYSSGFGLHYQFWSSEHLCMVFPTSSEAWSHKWSLSRGFENTQECF